MIDACIDNVFFSTSPSLRFLSPLQFFFISSPIASPNKFFVECIVLLLLPLLHYDYCDYYYLATITLPPTYCYHLLLFLPVPLKYARVCPSPPERMLSGRTEAKKYVRDIYLETLEWTVIDSYIMDTYREEEILLIKYAYAEYTNRISTVYKHNQSVFVWRKSISFKRLTYTNKKY